MSTGSETDEEAQDRISELPSSLRECILERLPIKEAVRTSVLSTKWRYSWNGMSRLIFDEAFEESMITLSEPDFAKIIDTSLTRHRGCIRKFVLHIPFNVEVSNLDIDAWLLILSQNGIQDLAVVCFAEDDDRFTLPPHFFNCSTLTHLSLEGADLRLSLNFPGFPNLGTLDLKGAVMFSNVLGSLISKCPLLKNLVLAFGIASDLQQPLVLDAPRLICLELYESVPGNIILSNVPSLISVKMMSSDCMVLDFSDSYCPLRLLGSLSGVKELALDFQFLEAFTGPCPKCLPTKLTSLTSLALEWIDLWRPEDLHFLFCFLRSFSNLQTLILRMYADDEDMKNHSLQYLLLESRDQSILSNLVTLRIEGCKGFRHEILLLKIFLARCPTLETLHIELAKVVEYNAVKNMARAIRQLPRLSNNVKLTYS